jgi:transcription factor SPN1
LFACLSDVAVGHHGAVSSTHSFLYSLPSRQGRDLEREVFGGSESELSSDEEEGKRCSISGRVVFFSSPLGVPEVLQQQQPQRSPAKVRAPKPREDYESSGGDSEDDYVQARPAIAKTKKRSSSSRKSAAAAEDGEPKAQRKRKRKQPVEIDLSDLPPEQGEFSLERLCLIADVIPSQKNPPGYEN